MFDYLERFYNQCTCPGPMAEPSDRNPYTDLGTAVVARERCFDKLSMTFLLIFYS